MSHLDEGTLHALLDGELELAEVKEIQLHLGSCTACGSRLQDVKQFLAEADRLVGALEIPAGGPRAQSAPMQPPPAPIPPREPENWESPVLLLPDPIEALERRKRWVRRLRWAAMIAVVVGTGRILTSSLRPNEPTVQLSDRTPSRPPTSAPVVSPEETVRPEPPVARQSRPAPSRPPVQRAAPEPKVLADRPAEDVAADQEDPFAAASEDTVTPPETVVASDADRRDSETENLPPEDTDEATRRAAAAALAELDRERRRERANAATAALPPPEPPPATEPAPRTLQQRAQVSSPIGLDEGFRQLNRPVHVIEGMSPELIGLVPGRSVAGADPARPVVRVVYVDTRGRMILLDQQRLRTGQAPGASAGSFRWVLGDVMLYLHGEPGPDALRSLQRRVR